MASVDDRIVRMEFDNAAFEKKLSTTLASLGQLDKALKFTGGTKGLTDVATAASNLNMNSVTQGIENVSKGFLALSTVALTVLSNITTKAMQAGAQLIKSFAIQPVLDGFREYETNMNSIQTILANTASKGTTLDQVSDALNRLNVYSDQTIYNFGQMARNIGTFTAAGVDLETSVSSIKGIANLAAMSGSSAEQASTAMYQLSQAIATGSLKLMDWNSVVNAGMGGEAFKSALFETGKAMGNVLKVPVDQTFTQWEDAGNSFRESLQDGWITADILTTTLSTFTGDMTEEMLLQKGFSEAQALNILKTADIARRAATEVKTFTQLMGTLKEAVGTGWADTFRIIIGNFTEAKDLWTNVSNAVGGFIQKTSEARNQILQGWKDFGGRNDLIDGIKAAFTDLSFVITAVKDAFSNIFPPVTAATLIRITAAFKDFMISLTPSAETLSNIKSIFQGFFAALSIGWEILKEGIKFVVGIGKALISIVSPGAVNFFVKIADGITSLQKSLVEGGKIKDFFDTLTKALQKPIAFLKEFMHAIGDVFSLFDKGAGEAVSAGFGRIGDRFESLKGIFSSGANFLEPILNAFGGFGARVVELLNKVFTTITDWLHELGSRIAATMKKGDFDAVLDAINTGLLGGIALLIANFLKKGFTFTGNFDIGSGLFQKIGRTFNELTNTLKAMQTNIKASALLKIAGAIAILTASVVVLSMIDSVALTRALTAMGVGFGELMASFAVLSKMASTPTGAASFTILSTGLIALATGILILSAAVKILSKMKWEELAKGLLAVTVLLGALVLASKPLAANSKGMITAGVGITAVAISLVVLGIAMKLFATMSWEEMAKGLVGVGAGLVVLAGGVKLLPSGAAMIARGAGLILVATSLNILAVAVALMGNMEWETIGKGLGGIAGGLIAIAGATHLMPNRLPIIAIGLVLIGIALNEIGVSMQLFALLSWDEIARGLTAMGGALLILAGALNLMGETAGGAIALGIAAVGLGVLAVVLKQFSKMSWDEIVHGLEALAVALGGIALVSLLLSPAIGPIALLGLALIALGAGLTLIGGGLFVLAKGLQMIGQLGKDAAESLKGILIAVGKALPALLEGVAQGIVDMIRVFLEATPVLLKALNEIIAMVLETLIRNLPKLMVLISNLITELIALLRKQGPPLIAVGLFLFLQLLKGIRDNIGKIVEVVADIIVNFLKAFIDEVPRTAKAIADAVIVMFLSAAEQLGRASSTILFGVGQAFMRGFFDGMQDQIGGIMSWFIALPGAIVSWIGDVVRTLWNKGIELIGGLLGGAQEMFWSVLGWFAGLKDDIVGFFTGAWSWLKQAGRDVISGLWLGLMEIWEKVEHWIEDRVKSAIHKLTHPWEFASPSHLMQRVGENIMEGWLIGMQKGWKDVDNFLSNLDATDSLNQNFGNNMTKALTSAVNEMNNMGEFNPTITPVLDLTQVSSEAKKIHEHINGGIRKLNPSFSIDQARAIAHQQRISHEDSSATEPSVTQGVNFEQNIYSPTQLSTSDIYKQTRNQIRIAKEELSIP